MKNVTLTASKRVAGNKSKTNALRRQGFIPAVVYGAGEEIPVSVNAREFNKTFHGAISENIRIDLDISGDKKRQVLIKDYQYDPIKSKIVHLDFIELDPNKPIKTHVPVHLEGNAPGVKLGGILEFFTQELEVECLPKDLPEYIVVNIDNLNLGDSIHVADISLPNGVKIISSNEQTVVAVTHATKESTDVVSEEETEEEVSE
ncbi:50S ribosomal protein L25 [Spirochaetia bacterium 38H-sp]|uniref:Large ribosomal subunit protein bL25 n=1 Tax=Rarispira pelagica TaxID=3141764 RepID=A0ABU9UE25_9SPIR